MEISGVLLLFLLGLRHGFDPDHIAIIDGLSVRLNAQKPTLAKWTGTLFAAGHSSVVTCIIVMIACFSHTWNFSKTAWDILDWIPGIMLVLVGLMNLRGLTRDKSFRPAGLKMGFIPSKLKRSSNPLAIILIGILFAMVFDTNTQAAAWAYTATSKISIANALILGCAFSAGMITTDTLDSRILFMLMQRSEADNAILNYRRKIGWVIVFVSLIVGAYKLINHIIPSIEVEESMLNWVGILFFSVMVSFYSYIIFGSVKRNKKRTYGN